MGGVPLLALPCATVREAVLAEAASEHSAFDSNKGRLSSRSHVAVGGVPLLALTRATVREAVLAEAASENGTFDNGRGGRRRRDRCGRCDGCTHVSGTRHRINLLRCRRSCDDSLSFRRASIYAAISANATIVVLRRRHIHAAARGHIAMGSVPRLARRCATVGEAVLAAAAGVWGGTLDDSSGCIM